MQGAAVAWPSRFPPAPYTLLPPYGRILARSRAISAVSLGQRPPQAPPMQTPGRCADLHGGRMASNGCHDLQAREAPGRATKAGGHAQLVPPASKCAGCRTVLVHSPGCGDSGTARGQDWGLLGATSGSCAGLRVGAAGGVLGGAGPHSVEGLSRAGMRTTSIPFRTVTPP